jgi:hypothetical protein
MSLSEKEIAILERFEKLPDSAAVPLKTCALVTGTCERTWRSRPPIKIFYITPGKRGANVGELRALTRGEARG